MTERDFISYFSRWLVLKKRKSSFKAEKIMLPFSMHPVHDDRRC